MKTPRIVSHTRVTCSVRTSVHGIWEAPEREEQQHNNICDETSEHRGVRCRRRVQSRYSRIGILTSYNIRERWRPYQQPGVQGILRPASLTVQKSHDFNGVFSPSSMHQTMVLE